MYVYRKTEASLWTVGFYDPSGKWESESDHGSKEAAADRVHWLNGGKGSVQNERRCPNCGAIHDRHLGFCIDYQGASRTHQALSILRDAVTFYLDRDTGKSMSAEEANNMRRALSVVHDILRQKGCGQFDPAVEDDSLTRFMDILIYG